MTERSAGPERRRGAAGRGTAPSIGEGGRGGGERYETSDQCKLSHRLDPFFVGTVNLLPCNLFAVHAALQREKIPMKFPDVILDDICRR